MGVRLAEQVFRFMNLVGCVDGYQNRSDLCGRPERDIPRRYVGRPDRNLGARLYAKRYQSTGKIVHVLAEFLICSCVVQSRIAERVLIRELLNHAVKYLREGQIDQFVFLPDVFAASVMIEIQMGTAGGLTFKPFHICQIMREDKVPFLHVLHPFRFPFQRDESVIIDGGKRPHHILDRQLSFAHDRIGTVFREVADMHKSDVSAEIPDRGIGRFAMILVRMVHVPQHAEHVVCVKIQEILQPLCVDIDASGLQKECDVFLSCLLNDDIQRFLQLFLVVMHDFGADKSHSHIGSQLYCFKRGFKRTVLTQIERGIETGDFNAPVADCPHCGFDPVRIQRAAALRIFRMLENIIEFKSGKLHFLGDIDVIPEGKCLPSACRKREFHSFSSS